LLSLIREHGEYERSVATISKAQLDHILEMHDAPVDIIVAEVGDALVGFAAITIDFSLWRAHRWAHLDCLFVKEDHRGFRIGQQLFQHMAALAHKKGADQLEWQTPDWNSDAIRFYRHQNTFDTVKVRFCQKLNP
jgi:GNAT superfamily N-acetyltransferase